MASKLNPAKARKIISLYGSSTEVRFKLIVPTVENRKQPQHELLQEVTKLLLEEKVKKGKVSDKKIEGFIVCPVCGNHKKLNKAPFDGAGSRVRQIKENRNRYAQIIANQEDMKIPENLFKVRDKQEHLLQYLTPDEIKAHIVPEIVRYIAQHFEIPPQYLSSSSAERGSYLEELVEEYLVTDRDGEEIIRQPFFNGSFKLSQAKFISIRLNFGNRRIGLQKKVLMSALAVAEIIKGIKSGVLLNAIKDTLEELPSDQKEAILQKLCKGTRVEAEEEVREEVISLLEEAEKEVEEKAKEKKPEKETEAKQEKEETQKWEEEMLFPEDEELFGNFDEIRKEIKALFAGEMGDYILASELFPKVKELVEEAKSGFKEVYQLSIADVVALIKMFEGKSLEEVKQIINENLALFGLNDTVVTDETVMFFLAFLGYIRIQLIRLKEITAQIHRALSKLNL